LFLTSSEIFKITRGEKGTLVLWLYSISLEDCMLWKTNSQSEAREFCDKPLREQKSFGYPESRSKRSSGFSVKFMSSYLC